MYKRNPRGCVVLQLLFYSVYSYTACSEDLTDGICGGICQSHSNSFWGLWDLCNDVMQALGFVQQLFPLPDLLLWVFIALFRHCQGCPCLLAALLTLASVNW